MELLLMAEWKEVELEMEETEETEEKEMDESQNIWKNEAVWKIDLNKETFEIE